MKKYSVRILHAAWEELAQIEVWYLLKFYTDTALKVSSSILSTIERLELFPDSGVLTPDDDLNKAGYRMVICKYHGAVYKSVGNRVYIYHIFDMQRDYSGLFADLREA